jgi:hypothetical protein
VPIWIGFFFSDGLFKGAEYQGPKLCYLKLPGLLLCSDHHIF